MQETEKSRYEAAIKAFADAFGKGYAEGKRLLAAGDLTRPILRFPFSIDVPRRAVLDNEWSGYVQQFADAGIAAALSLHRQGEVQLDATEAHDNSALSSSDSTCRWHVVETPG